MDVIGLISLVLGVVSFGASIVFFALGAKSERQNQKLLNDINEAMQRWQGQIMDSSIELLNSRVEIIGSRISLEDAKLKREFAREIASHIKYIIEHPAEGDQRIAQSHQLEQLMNCFHKTMGAALPPEMMAEIANRNRSE